MPDMRFEFYPYLRSNILQVLDDWERIDFDPDYQRKSGAWNLEKQQYFIDSIINGMDLTKLYFHERSPGSRDAQTVNYGVIDGKQRLEAIQSFAQDQFPLSGEFEYLHGDRGNAAGLRYSELLAEFPELRARFDDTMLPIVVMRADDEVLIEGLFVRLNEQASLNAAEKRNAFGGPIPLAIRELTKHKFFAECVPFEDGRYRHRDLSAKLLWIIHEDRFVSTKRRDLDEFVRAYRSDPELLPRPRILLRGAKKLVDEMYQFFERDDPLLRNVGWITLYIHLFRMAMASREPLNLGRAAFERFVQEVEEARRLIRLMADGELAAGDVDVSPDLAQFDSLRQSPNDATALRTRYAILQRYFSREYDTELPEDADQDE